MSMKRSIAPITSGCVKLYLLEEGDLSNTLRWRNQDHIRQWFIFSNIISDEQHRGWFEKYKTNDNDFVFIIAETCDLNKPVGQISLYNINWEQKQAEFGRLLIGEESALHKGIARQALQMIVDFGLNDLGLQRIYLEVFKTNTAAISLYQKCGFVFSGERDDLLIMEISPSS